MLPTLIMVGTIWTLVAGHAPCLGHRLAGTARRHRREEHRTGAGWRRRPRGAHSGAGVLRDRRLEVARMGEVEFSAGIIEYDDSGGDGPILVFLHGVAMDGSVWAPVVASLRRDHRCVVPTLPLGAH